MSVLMVKGLHQQQEVILESPVRTAAKRCGGPVACTAARSVKGARCRRACWRLFSSEFLEVISKEGI